MYHGERFNGVSHLVGAALALLLPGGVFYTSGMVFYAPDEKLPHAHGIWHLFVLAGSISHFLVMLFYVL